MGRLSGLVMPAGAGARTLPQPASSSALLILGRAEQDILGLAVGQRTALVSQHCHSTLYGWACIDGVEPALYVGIVAQFDTLVFP